MLNNSDILSEHLEMSTVSRVFAYCRVSTADQTTENQVQEIARAGFQVSKHHTIEEVVSGSVAACDRAGWQRLLQKLDPGDVLVVTKLDRLGRNAMDVRASVETLAQMNVRVHCLALGGVDLTSSAGKLTMSVISAMAEFERDLLVERTQAGLSRAKAEGKTLGRPSSLTEAQQQQARERLAQGHPVAAIARDLGTSRQTIMRLREQSASASQEAAQAT